MGYGKAQIQASGWAVVVVTVLATAAFSWAAIL
jgi:hypothetical protein